MTDQAIIIQRTKVFSDIVGCAFRSYNYFHWGFDEIVYEAGLKAELEDLGYEVFRQQEFPIYYKGRPTEVNRRMDLVVRDSAKALIVEKAFDRKYGARPLKRKLQEEVENLLAEEIIRGSIKAGDHVVIATKNKQISWSKE